MPGAPRFTKKPSIQQTPQGDLLMECHLEADPSPDIVWHHAGTPISAGPRVTLTLTNLQDILYKAVLIIKEPSVGDGGAYKCTASNQFGESNANINLNFAGGADDQKPSKGPTFLSKPKIIPKDGGALVVMECRVKSASTPTAQWYKDGAAIYESSLFKVVYTDLGDSQHLFQLEIHGPSAGDAGQYRCNIKDDQGETNANLALNFEQDTEERQEKSEKREKHSASPKPTSRPGTPKKQMKSREGTPKKSLKSREGTPKKSVRSRTSTPVKEMEKADETTAHKAQVGDKTDMKDTMKSERSELEDADSAGGQIKGKPPSGKITEKTTEMVNGAEFKSAQKRSEKDGQVVEERDAKTRKKAADNVEKSELEQADDSKMDVDAQNVKRKSETTLPLPDEKKARQRSKSPSKRRSKSRSKSPFTEYEEISTDKAKSTSKRAPVVLEPAKSKVAKEGETVVLECEFQCDPSTKIAWVKDGREIKPSAEFRTFFDGQTARLTINHMTEDKSGLFKCNALSKFGEAHTSAMVKFEHGEDEYDPRKRHRESIAEIEERLMAEHKKADEAKKKRKQEESKMQIPNTIVTDEDGLRSQAELMDIPIGSTGDAGDEDETPSSGLTISPQLRSQLLGLQQSGGGTPGEGDSEDEMSESISELPNISGQRSRRVSSQKPELKKTPKKKAEEAPAQQKFALKKVDRDAEARQKSPSRSRGSSVANDEQSGLRRSASGTSRPGEIEGRSRRRSSVDMRRESISDVLEKASTPLEPTGPVGPPHIAEIPENVTVPENETAVFKCKIQGNPVPKIKWSKGLREIMAGGRFKILTDRAESTVMLVMTKCRSQDDGPYTLTIENEHGQDSVAVKLLVTSGAGLDLRSMLKHREYEGGAADGSADGGAGKAKEKDKPMTEAERRQSLFPGKKKEKWERPLEDKTVQQQVDKICEWKCVYSRPNAKIRWYKDKKEIFSGGLKYKIVIEKAVCTLIINNPEVDDSGKYTCEANGLPTTAILTVDEPPMKYNFITPLPNTQEIYRTKQGVLTCKVNNKRAPLVWHRNGKPIAENDKRFLIESDAVGRFTLTIKEVIQEDQGEWMAKITNDVFSKVQVYVEEPRHTFVIPLKSQKVMEKETTTLETDVNDKDADVEWWHDGVKITLDSKKFVAEAVGRKRRLTINNARMEDHGEYKCTTKDDQTLAQLIVDALNKFIVKLADMEVIEKEDVSLRCETQDTKTPAIWSTKGKTITSMPGGKYETTSRAGVHMLKISKIELSEGDVYEINVAGLEGSCNVTVLEAEKKPILNWKPKRIDMEAGKPEVIKIPFQIKGARRTAIKPVLKRDGKPVDMKLLKDVEVVINGDVAEIKFKNPQKEDTGKWALELGNSGGTVLAPFEVFVKDKPKAPNGPLETSNINAKGCDLKWKPSDPQEGAPVKAYIVEMQEGRSGNWVKIGETKGTDFKVKDLKEHGEYKFRVKAVNEVGSSEPLMSESILAKNPYNVPGKPKKYESSRYWKRIIAT